jgi:hypothetical protein
VPQLTSNQYVADRMTASVDVLMNHLAEGRHVYGMCLSHFCSVSLKGYGNNRDRTHFDVAPQVSE